MRSADAARDERRFSEAAELYAEAARKAPKRAEIHVQLGNMLKDTGQYQPAVLAYEHAHNLFAQQLTNSSNANKNTILEKVADIYVQLGHLFKKAGMRGYAVGYYRSAHAIRPDDRLVEEIKTAQLSANGILEQNLSILPPNLNALPLGQYTNNSSSAVFDILSPNRQCLCWERSHDTRSDPDGVEVAICRACGTEYSDVATALNTTSETLRVNPCVISKDEFRSLTTALDVETDGKSIAIVGAEIDDPDGLNLDLTVISADNRGLSPGLTRCTFDVVIMWNISRGVSDVRHMLDHLFQILKPGGQLCLGFKNKLNPPTRVLKQVVNRSVKAQANESQTDPQPGDKLFFLFNERTLIQTIAPLTREAKIDHRRHRGGDGLTFLKVRKSTKLSVGVMSGIGDAVWSFVIADAVKAKYGADKVVYHVHDSGDNRRKRSNNMLARFDFVDDLVSEVFQVHADTPMDSKTGHLNYRPSGEVPVDSTDSFDYRLIINTYLEHGQSYNEICDELELDQTKLNFDFFKSYREQPIDTVAVEKVKSLAGEKYVVFYYGALIDNTEGGLNRDAMWTAEDWNNLGRMIHEEYGCKIVVIGAAYDLEYARKIAGKTTDLFYVNTIGQLDITETLALIQRSQFVISFPAGVGIVGPYMRVPTVIFWRPKHLSYHIMHDRAGFDPGFATNWVPPKVMARGLYYPAWYGTDTPATIMDVVRKGDWWNREVTTPIGNWPEDL